MELWDRFRRYLGEYLRRLIGVVFRPSRFFSRDDVREESARHAVDFAAATITLHVLIPLALLSLSGGGNLLEGVGVFLMTAAFMFVIHALPLLFVGLVYQIILRVRTDRELAFGEVLKPLWYGTVYTVFFAYGFVMILLGLFSSSIGGPNYANIGGILFLFGFPGFYIHYRGLRNMYDLSIGEAAFPPLLVVLAMLAFALFAALST